MKDSYFSSERFLNIVYWASKWNARQFFYFRYMKYDSNFEEYEKVREPKLPELDSPVKHILEEFEKWKKLAEENQAKLCK
jgi:hypothetical protein